MNIKPVTVDTVYEAVKSFIETNSILKQVIEDEFCKDMDLITLSIDWDGTVQFVCLKRVANNDYYYDKVYYYTTNQELVRIINDFIA